MSRPIDIGTRRELFVDDFLIERMTGVSLDLKRPERREVVFVADAPWEDNVAGGLSLFSDGDVVRFYYRASILPNTGESEQIIAVAESTDGGISFQRPTLGIVEFKGSRDNNILMIGGHPHVPPAFRDTNPACPPEARYKGLSGKWMGLFAMCSPDGLRWKSMLDGTIEMEGAFDTVNTAFWDTIAGCYRCYTRSWADPEADFAPTQNVRRGCIRAIQSSTSQDFIHWTRPVQNVYADGERTMQMYTNSILPCPGAEHIYVGFPNRYVEERKPRADHPYPGVNDALFMSSRDGIHWNRFREAWVRPGLDELNWTERNNYPEWGIIETSPREWSLYISEHYRHASERPRWRRLSIRPHGFVSVRADYGGGEFVTRPLTVGGRRLRLNFSTSAAGCVQVELQDAQGRPIPGFALKDMSPMYGDELDRIVSWQGGAELTALVGKAVRLRFALKDADVFGFRTE
jgi:hypothetical protein